MDVHNPSKEAGGYLKMTTNNERVKVLRGVQPRCSQDDRTLSKKGRGVKIVELKGNCRRRLIRFWTRFTTEAHGTQSEISPLDRESGDADSLKASGPAILGCPLE